MNELFTEAVFADGKKKIEPLEAQFKVVKDILTAEIRKQDESERRNERTPYKFNPVMYWKNPEFKKLENTIADIFGFRHVLIEPYRERYSTKAKIFESKQINAVVYRESRFPIDGLVTDKGFYDSTHSLVMDIFISLGLINTLEPDEITAVLLHEFGHGIDPALMEITYAETNVLSKYLTNRIPETTAAEKKVMKLFGNKKWKTGFVSFFMNVVPEKSQSLMSRFLGIFESNEKQQKRALERIKKAINADITRFDHVHFSEAYADNFARMYGYGPALARGLSRADKVYDDRFNSRYAKEKARNAAIVSITESMLKDVHKTDIHRIRALLREYKLDIEDPNTPDVVKKQLQSDADELEKVLDDYLNNRGDMQKRVNKLINDELQEMEEKGVFKEAMQLEEELTDLFEFTDLDLLTEGATPRERELKKIVDNIHSNLKVMHKDLWSVIEPAIRKHINENKGYWGTAVNYLYIDIGDEKGPKDEHWFHLPSKYRIKRIITKIIDSPEEKNVYCYFHVCLTSSIQLSKEKVKELKDAMYKAVDPVLKKYIDKDWLNIPPSNYTYYYTYWVYDLSFRLCLGEKIMTDGVDISVFESVDDISV